MRIIILGLGRVGSHLLEALSQTSLPLVAVDREKGVCEQTAASTRATIVCGDFTSPHVLDSLRFSQNDCVYAVSGQEEANFLAAMYAKQAGAGKAVVKVDSIEHVALLQKLGLDAFVGEHTIAQHLANQVLHPTIFQLLLPGVSNLELFEEDVPEKYSRMTVDELENYAGAGVHVIAVYDSKKFMLPDKRLPLGKGAKVVVLSTGKRKVFK
ncbi:TrkA family potassium uptake protein [Candidatus Micrarchaeota archaeon]|nr:TrkA family potassium uptake protein [Candidatus Micrarchaeota archaeon]